jgi:hypothetical protein
LAILRTVKKIVRILKSVKYIDLYVFLMPIICGVMRITLKRSAVVFILVVVLLQVLRVFLVELLDCYVEAGGFFGEVGSGGGVFGEFLEDGVLLYFAQGGRGEVVRGWSPSQCRRPPRCRRARAPRADTQTEDACARLPLTWPRMPVVV